MKKLFAVLACLILWACVSTWPPLEEPVEAGVTYFKSGLTGGTSDDLDGVDAAGLIDGYRALVISHSAGASYLLTYDDDSGATESTSVPLVIKPDLSGGGAYAGQGRWVGAPVRNVDLSGSPIYIDDDKDSFISSPTDDAVAILVGGSNRITITNTAIDMNLPLDMNENALYLDQGSDTYITENGTSIEIFANNYKVLDMDSTSALFAEAVDLQGNILDLDADNDTSFTADTDDQIDVEISGADDFRFTANTFTALSGSSIATNTITETTAASGVTIDSLKIKDGEVYLEGNKLYLDADEDTYIYSSSDDRVDFYRGGTLDFYFNFIVFGILDKYVQLSNDYALQSLDSAGTSSYELIQLNSSDEVEIGDADDDIVVKVAESSWDGAHLKIGSYHIWIDSTGDIRIKSSAPTGDTDGTIIGTQS